jgi:hypothetical protein
VTNGHMRPPLAVLSVHREWVSFEGEDDPMAGVKENRDSGGDAHGRLMPSFRIRALRVLRLSPRISAAPFFPLTFH